MKRRIKYGYLILLCTLIVNYTLYLPVHASEERIAIHVNGSPLNTEVNPIIRGGRVLVPIRAVGEALMGKVEWNADYKKVTVEKGSHKIVLFINSVLADTEKGIFILDVPAQIVNNRTFVPLRFISEALGAEVSWDAISRTVTINTDDKEIVFTEKALENKVRNLINKPIGTITRGDIKDITQLTLDGNVDIDLKEINDLSTLAEFESLWFLVINSTNVHDLSPLSEVDNLTHIYFNDCPVSDLSPLSEVDNLTNISLNECPVSDLSPLSEIDNLTNISFYDCPISDLSPLSNLNNLSNLYISDCPVSDLSPLTNMQNFKLLMLYETKVRDLTPLSGLTKLENIYINRNDYITDYSPIKEVMIKSGYGNDYEKMQATCEKAKEIIGEIIQDGMSELEKEKAIHDYLVTHTRYDIENYHSNTIPLDSYDPYGVIIKGTGVCEGYARAALMLLTLADIEATLVIGEAHGQAHAWNRVKINGTWYNLDVTWDDPDDPIINNVNKIRYNYFNIDDQTMSIDHIWQ